MEEQEQGWKPPVDAVEASSDAEWTPPSDAVVSESLKKKEFSGQQPSGESLQPYQAATQPSGLSSLSEAKVNVPEGERGIEQPSVEVEPVKKEELTQYNILPGQKLTGDKLYTTNPKTGVTTFKTLSKDELEKYKQAAQPKSGFQEFAQAKIKAEKQILAEPINKEKEPTADDLKQRVIELDNLSAKNIDEIKNIDIQLGIISNKQQSLSGMPKLMYASQEANKLFAQQIALKKQRDMLVMKQQAYDTKANEAMGLLTNQETQRLVEESNTPFWGTFINGIKTSAEEIKDAIPYIKDIIDIGAQTTGALPTDYNSMFSKMVANKDLRKNEFEKAYIGYKATSEAEQRVEGAGLTDNLPLYKFRKYTGHVFSAMAIPAIASAGAAAMTGGTGLIIPLTNASIFGIMGLGSGALNTYFIARENGLSPDDSIIASERGALIGLTTQFGLGLTMGKAGHFLNSKFNTAIKPLTATATKLGLESIGTGTEMAGAKFVENVATGAATALPVKPTEGLGESFLEGMLFHATAHFGGVPSYLKSKSLFRAVDKVKTPEGISRMRKQVVDSNKGGLINNAQMVQLNKQLDDAIDFGKYIPEDITDEEIRDRFFDTIMKYDEYRKLQKESPDALKGYYDEKLSGLDNVIKDLIEKQKELDTIKQQQYEKAAKTGEQPSLDTRNAKPIEEVALTDINKGDVIIGYHSTPTGDIDTGGELGIHIGTKEVAENINKGKRGGKGEVKKLAFKPKKPLILGDMPSWSSINVLNELLRQKFTGVDKEKLQEIRDSDLSEKEKQQSIIDLIKGQGYDSVAYQNFDEGNGEYSYILFDKAQLEEQGETQAEPTKTFEQKVEETRAKIKNKNLFIEEYDENGNRVIDEKSGLPSQSVGEIISQSDIPPVPTSVKEINGIEFVEFSNPETKEVDVIVTGKQDGSYVGYYRLYENGKPTNKWSSKFENPSRNKEDFKTMISGVQEMLPKGHEYTEKTSISTDGLRIWAQQLQRGYELQYDENGKLITNLVAINGDAIVNELGIPVEKGEFENIKVKTKEDFEKVKAKLLPYLENFGLGENDIKWLTGTVKINLPVLKSKAQKPEAKSPQAEPTKTFEQKVEETAKALEGVSKNKEQRFYPDDRVILTTKDGKEIEVGFRGYNDGGSKAVIWGDRGSGINQMEVDVTELRAKNKYDKLSKKERDKLYDKIDFSQTEYRDNLTDIELQDLSVRFPKENKLSNKDKQDRNALQIAITPLIQWQEQEYGVDNPNDPINIKLAKEHQEAIDRIITNDKYSNLVSEAYHKAKEDGSNPELVKSVEELLGKPAEQPKVKPELKVTSPDLALIDKTIDKLYEIKDPKKSGADKRLLKESMNKMLSENPRIKYIFENLKDIENQLKSKDLITKKGKCP